jgi:hypothetical protein
MVVNYYLSNYKIYTKLFPKKGISRWNTGTNFCGSHELSFISSSWETLDFMGKAGKVIIYLGILLGVLSLIRTTYLIWNSYLLDFSVFYDAAQSTIQHANPYTNPHLFTQASYPPITFLFFIPLALLPFGFASKIWIILSLAFFYISLRFLNKIKHLSFLKFVIIFIATVSSFPFKFTLGMGQINLLVLGCLILFLYYLGKSKVVSEFLLSIAVVLKLFPGFLLMYFFIKRKFRYILTVLFFILALLFLSILYCGIDTYYYYFSHVLLPMISNPAGSVYYNQSITGFFARLKIYGSYLFITRLILMLVTLFTVYKKKINVYYAISILLTLVLLINNFTWQHHLVLLLIPYYFFLSLDLSIKDYLLLILSYILIAINIKNPLSFEHSLLGLIVLSHGFFGILLLWCMQLANIITFKNKK